jgi:hypothetical protein
MNYRRAEALPPAPSHRSRGGPSPERRRLPSFEKPTQDLSHGHHTLAYLGPAMCTSEYNEVRNEQGRLGQTGGAHPDRQHVEPAWANEAVSDPEACWLDTDPARVSGLSVLVIGYSAVRTTC